MIGGFIECLLIIVILGINTVLYFAKVYNKYEYKGLLYSTFIVSFIIICNNI